MSSYVFDIFVKNDKRIKYVYFALILIMAVLLPMVTDSIPIVGIHLETLHITTLLCGFLCGWRFGLLAGIISAFIQPSLYANMDIMALTDTFLISIRLAFIGTMAGMTYRKSKKTILATYMALIFTMIFGRIIYAAEEAVMLLVNSEAFVLADMYNTVIGNNIPGIILQILFIPIVVISAEREGLNINK